VLEPPSEFLRIDASLLHEILIEAPEVLVGEYLVHRSLPLPILLAASRAAPP
jgi:hypothetical protein